MTAARAGDDPDTATRILDVAERLVQQRGFNGFSYADVADEVGVTRAALHYHFAGKAELGEALVERYAGRFAAALAALDDSGADARAKLDGYVALYADVLRAHRMCLCGMLAAEFQTLPDGMRQAVLRFFEANERWLEGVLEHGREAGVLGFDGPAREAARSIVSALEGAMLVARPYGDVARFESVASRLLSGLGRTSVAAG